MLKLYLTIMDYWDGNFIISRIFLCNIIVLFIILFPITIVFSIYTMYLYFLDKCIKKRFNKFYNGKLRKINR